MLKMRRVWRRTSSSQADPSPWRHCWTSWASCSNVSSASEPTTVQGVSASRFLSQKTAGSPSRPANYGTKTASEMFPLNPGRVLDRHWKGILLRTRDFHKRGRHSQRSAASRASIGALSPKVSLRCENRSTSPGPKTKLPPNWKGFLPSLCWEWPEALARARA